MCQMQTRSKPLETKQGPWVVFAAEKWGQSVQTEDVMAKPRDAWCPSDSRYRHPALNTPGVLARLPTQDTALTHVPSARNHRPNPGRGRRPSRVPPRDRPVERLMREDTGSPPPAGLARGNLPAPARPPRDGSIVTHVGLERFRPAPWPLEQLPRHTGRLPWAVFHPARLNLGPT